MAYNKNSGAHSASQAITDNLQERLLDVVKEEALVDSLKRILVDENEGESANFACHQWVVNYAMSVSGEDVAERLETARAQLEQMLDRTGLLTQYGDGERLQL